MEQTDVIRRVEELAQGKTTFADVVASVSIDEILEASPDGVLMADGDGVIVYTNKQASNLFQYPRGGLIGQKVEVLIPERFRIKHVGHREGYAHRPIPRMMGSYAMPLFGQRRNGEEFPVDISLSHVYSSKGLAIIVYVRERPSESV